MLSFWGRESVSVRIEFEPTMSSANFDPIFPDIRDFQGDGVFLWGTIFTEMLPSYILGPSMVKYCTQSNKRHSKLHAVIDFFFNCNLKVWTKWWWVQTGMLLWTNDGATILDMMQVETPGSQNWWWICQNRKMMKLGMAQRELLVCREKFEILSVWVGFHFALLL